MSREHSAKCGVGRFPTVPRLTFGTLRNGVEGAENQYIVETDDVIYDRTRVPAFTWRRTVPFAVGRSNGLQRRSTGTCRCNELQGDHRRYISVNGGCIRLCAAG